MFITCKQRNTWCRHTCRDYELPENNAALSLTCCCRPPVSAPAAVRRCSETHSGVSFIHPRTHSPMLMFTSTRQLPPLLPHTHCSRLSPHSSVPTIHQDVSEAARFRPPNTVWCFFLAYFEPRNVSSLSLTCIQLAEGRRMSQTEGMQQA